MSIDAEGYECVNREPMLKIPTSPCASLGLSSSFTFIGENHDNLSARARAGISNRFPSCV